MIRDFLIEVAAPGFAVLMLIVALTCGVMAISTKTTTHAGHYIVVEHRSGAPDITYDCKAIQWCDERRVQVWTTDGRNLVLAGDWSVEEIKAAEAAP